MTTKKNFLYVGGAERVNPVNTDLELEEFDVWSSNEVVSTEPRRSIFGPRAPKKSSKRGDRGTDRERDVVATSLPVNVPDWSKILRGEYKNRAVENALVDDNEDEENESDRIPPHEYLARTRMASLSVHEGIGRTLKGRDMRRVRNAIWKQIGFED